jgi:hypothetical protein
VRTRRLPIAGLCAVVLTAAAARAAAAAPCTPPQSQAMLTGPVWQAMAAECRWVDALARHDVAAATHLLDPAFTRVGAMGGVANRDAVLQAVRAGSLGRIAMDVRRVQVPFSSGSTNVVVATWTIPARTYRVTDVFFCRLAAAACVDHLIAEQLTIVTP